MRQHDQPGHSRVPAGVLIVSRWLSAESEPWLYRQIQGLKRYRALVAVQTHFNRTSYPFADVTEFASANPWYRRLLMLSHLIRESNWPSREQFIAKRLERLLTVESVSLMHVHFLMKRVCLSRAGRMPELR
jgi:hypothetical protein